MKLPLVDLKKKMTSLLGSYRREKSRIKSSRMALKHPDDVYQSAWFAFDAFEFMSNKNESGKMKDIIENNDLTYNKHQINAKTLAQDESESQIEHEENDDNTAYPQQKQLKKRNKKRTIEIHESSSSEDSESISETFRIMPQPGPPCDSYTAFGQYIANELKKYDAITLAHVKRDLCGILFRADTGAYEQFRPKQTTLKHSTSLSKSPESPIIQYRRDIYADPISSSALLRGSPTSVSRSSLLPSEYKCKKRKKKNI